MINKLTNLNNHAAFKRQYHKCDEDNYYPDMGAGFFVGLLFFGKEMNYG
jgi:hypothetical protein